MDHSHHEHHHHESGQKRPASGQLNEKSEQPLQHRHHPAKQEGGSTPANVHVKHAGHHTDDFLKRFWICLALTIPVLLFFVFGIQQS